MRTGRGRIGLILLGAFALRVVQLDARSLWYDEAFSILLSEKTPGQIAAETAADVHSLFFYSILHEWLKVAGGSGFAVRFFSVLVGVATVAVVYRLARELWQTRGGDSSTARLRFLAPLAQQKPATKRSAQDEEHGQSETVGLVAALIAAVAPFQVAYSQEARMYALLGFFAVLMVLSYVMSEKVGSRAWWAGLVLSAAGMLYAHNLGVFFGAALGLWIVARAAVKQKWRSLAPWVGAGVVILLLWLPELVLVPTKLGRIEQAYWISAPDGLTALQTLLTFTVDFDNAQLPTLLLPVALIAALVIVVLLGVETARGGWRDEPVGFLAVMAGVPPVLIFIESQFSPVYISRALMPSFLMLVILVAWLLVVRLPKPIGRGLGVGLVLVAVAVFAFYFPYADFPRPPFREALAFLGENVQAGDAIVHDNKLTFFPMDYYARAKPLPQSFVADPAGSGSDTLSLPDQEALRLYASSLEQATGGHGRVWFVMFREAREEAAQAPNLEWMRQQYHQVQERSFHDLELYLFEK